MQSFEALLQKFDSYFELQKFDGEPLSLYQPANYILEIGGKRIRPVLCLLGNELFGEIHPDAYRIAAAVEIFHNFTLVHDDIMDKAELRRGKPAVHKKFGESTAILTGDVMLIGAYQQLGQVQQDLLPVILSEFNQTAREICEGQQMDMDFEAKEDITLEDYLKMITLKTSVLLASSLKMGAIRGGAGKGNQDHIYEFGKNLGIAFQIQDDYLDAFGDSSKTGKKQGGDIMENKKTFLLIKAMEILKGEELQSLKNSMKIKTEEKINIVLNIFKNAGVDQWAEKLKTQYMEKAMYHLEEIAVLSKRKEPLRKLAASLFNRDY